MKVIFKTRTFFIHQGQASSDDRNRWKLKSEIRRLEDPFSCRTPEYLVPAWACSGTLVFTDLTLPTAETGAEPHCHGSFTRSSDYLVLPRRGGRIVVSWISGSCGHVVVITGGLHCNTVPAAPQIHRVCMRYFWFALK